MGHPRFEQLFRATGHGAHRRRGARALSGSGNRIRRQGIRNVAAFWGHAWQAAVFPSGRASPTSPTRRARTASRRSTRATCSSATASWSPPGWSTRRGSALAARERPGRVLRARDRRRLIASNCFPFVLTVSSCFRCSVVSGPLSPIRMVPVNPITAFSGVLSSWAHAGEEPVLGLTGGGKLRVGLLKFQLESPAFPSRRGSRQQQAHPARSRSG